MDNILDVAAFIISRYKQVSGEVIDEMKLHKLLYFTQRESFAITGLPAFEGDLQGWKFGPVSPEVRSFYCGGELLCKTRPISETIEYIANNVIYEYGAMASWKLSQITHQDSSWLNSREGLSQSENGNVVLSLEDIKKDSKKIRPYDHMWDMYYDEFETVEAIS